MDASFLNVMLYDVGYGMTQVAIGDNLMIRPWIETLVRLNNSFIVKRGVSVRQMLDVSRTLSAYIRHTINETKDRSGLHSVKAVPRIRTTVHRVAY